MLGLPWWAWVVLAVVVAVLLLKIGARRWRAAYRREFIAYLRREAPDFEIVAEREYELDLRRGGSAGGTLRLDRLYAEGSAASAGDTVRRDEMFAHFVKMLREGKNMDALDAERDRARVMPRVVRDAFLEALRADGMRRTGQTLPSLPTGVPGLSIVFVLDSETSVAYLTDDLLGDLRLSPEEALVVAKENLSRPMDMKAVVRSVLAEKSISVLKGGDSFDAARILLVPACLAEGQQLAAAIPDRDTLVLTMVPANGDWSAVRKLARTPAGEALWPEPLQVTSAGIAAV